MGKYTLSTTGNAAWMDAAEHAISMQDKYGFCADEAMVQEAVSESASMLGIALTEADTEKACEYILSYNDNDAA